MHHKLLKEASHEQIVSFLEDYIDWIKHEDPKMYECLEDKLYHKVYGCHFNDWMLDKVLAKMVNEDGTTGPHYSLAESNELARKYDIPFNVFNQYDWCYALNMIYSDYYNTVPNETRYYVELAKKFLLDKDAPVGKAYKYYLAMK